MLFYYGLQLLMVRRIQGQGYQHPGRAIPTPLYFLLIYASTATSKQGVSCSETCHDCKCCESAGGADIGVIVGPVGNGGSNGDPLPALVRAEGKCNVRGGRFSDATATSQGDGNGAVAAIVGTEDKYHGKNIKSLRP